jgi:hypothetical protein
MTEEKLIAELESLESVQERIDRIAEDVDSRTDRYASIGAWKLAPLVDLDLEDTGDWDRTFMAFRQDIEDQGCDYPFAEFIELLDGKIPRERFTELSEEAKRVLDADGAKDLKLRKREIALLKDAYAEDSAERTGSGFVLAYIEIEGSDGNTLQFEVCIGDGGELSDACTSYDLRDGKGLDTAEYVEVGS